MYVFIIAGLLFIVVGVAMPGSVDTTAVDHELAAEHCALFNAKVELISATSSVAVPTTKIEVRCTNNMTIEYYREKAK